MLAVLGLVAAAPVTAASATTEPPAAPEAEGKVTDWLDYVGGPGGAASGDPIRIGYINQDGGAIVVSGVHDDGVDFAVQYINEQAGGIGGRPIEIVQ
jgi:branched-chain amino acid transport system substrate-binding protein